MPPNQMVRPRDAGAITHQPTRVDILSPRITCGYGVACRERHELNTLLREERVGTDQECIGPPLDSGDELKFPLRALRRTICCPVTRIASSTYFVSSS